MIKQQVVVAYWAYHCLAEGAGGGGRVDPPSKGQTVTFCL